MNRTPRSASRRASRQLAAKEPSPGWQPYSSSVLASSPRDVHQLRHAGLHLKRHLVLRDARGDLGIVHQRLVLPVQRVDRRPRRPPAARAKRPPGWTDTAPDRPCAQLHALIPTGQKPAAHCRAAIGWFCPPLAQRVSTTKPGRFSASLPSHTSPTRPCWAGRRSASRCS